MCCGHSNSANPAPRTTTTTTVVWNVLDASGNVVETKTSEVAAKLAAARIGGTAARKG